jgi:uncharacterized protein (UPF0332 family)
MSFDWQQYLDLAAELIDGRLNNTSQQARHRAAISRAYYGVFIPTRDAMEKKLGKRYEPTSVHRAVRADLQSSDADACNSLGVLFGAMVKRRVDADYDARSQDDEKMALKQLSDARRALKLLNEI